MCFLSNPRKKEILLQKLLTSDLKAHWSKGVLVLWGRRAGRNYRVHKRELLCHQHWVEGQEVKSGKLVLKDVLLWRGKRAGCQLSWGHGRGGQGKRGIREGRRGKSVSAVQSVWE